MDSCDRDQRVGNDSNDCFLLIRTDQAKQEQMHFVLS